MNRFARLAALMLFVHATSVWAGIADSPLPVLEAGKATQHVYSVPGVIAGGVAGFSTFFLCTSTDSVPITVAVESFPYLGGDASNDAASHAWSLAPGATVVFACTGGAAGVAFDTSIACGPISRGSARILATSTKLLCTAWVADVINTQPIAGWQLTVTRKAKQKGD